MEKIKAIRDLEYVCGMADGIASMCNEKTESLKDIFERIQIILNEVIKNIEGDNENA